MNLTEMKATRKLVKAAREERNASKTNNDFDYWHSLLTQAQLKLKTQENKK